MELSSLKKLKDSVPIEVSHNTSYEHFGPFHWEFKWASFKPYYSKVTIKSLTLYSTQAHLEAFEM